MKGQVLSVREVFAFLIGVLILSGTYALFNETIKPKIVDYAIREDIKHIATHVGYAISTLTNYANKLQGNINITQVIDMPLMYGDYNYRLFFENKSICSSPTDYTLNFVYCFALDNNITEYRGAFVSGTNLVLSIKRINNKTEIRISNA